MTHRILSSTVTSISELKKNPVASLKKAGGDALAVLNHNEPSFYCVPADLYEKMVDMVEEVHLAQVVSDRAHEEEIEVSLHDL